MTTVNITAIDLNPPDHVSEGFYVDQEGVLRSVDLSHGEAQAILAELSRGTDSVGYEILDDQIGEVG